MPNQFYKKTTEFQVIFENLQNFWNEKLVGCQPNWFRQAFGPRFKGTDLNLAM